MPPPSRFLQYDLGVLTRLYAHEADVTVGMPYAHLARWPVPADEDGPTPFRAQVSYEKFAIRNDRPSDWSEVSDAAYRALEEDGHDFKRSEPLIRVRDFDASTSMLFVEPAEYNDQRKSHLVLDFRVPGRPTLREMLSEEYGPRFPALSDDRLANTLGVATLVIVRHGKTLKAYCVRRPKKGVAVFQDTWSCTASGAAKWTARESQSYFPNPAEDMLAELDEEVGLKRKDLLFLAPIALSREVVRAGKPELLFLAGCALSEEELRKRRKNARRLAQRRRQPLEVEEDKLLQSAAWFVDLNADPATFFSDDIAHQATGLLMEAAERQDELSRRF